VIKHGLPRESKAQAEAARLARGREGLEEPLANFSIDSWSVIANLDQNGTMLRNGRDSNIASAGHGVERIYEQVDENSLDALAV
jgi:hypothetical protein